MVKNLTIKQKILFLFLLVSFVVTLFSAIYSYYQEKQNIMRGIDDKLLAATYGVAQIFGDQFHDRIDGPNSITPEEHYRNMMVLTRYANQIGVRYLYSAVQSHDSIFWATTSSTPEELNTSTYTQFYSYYPEASDSLLATFREKRIHFDFPIDQWGEFRSVYIPFTTPAGRTYVVGADVTIGFVRDELNAALLNTILTSSAIFLIFFVLAYLVVDRVSKPLTHLTEYIRSMVAKEFAPAPDTVDRLNKIAERSNDEVGKLAGAFVHMEETLQNYIVNLTETTAEKERIEAAKQKIESDLKIATDIQNSMLPKVFPGVPHRPEFDMYASVHPAKEVGGDLYDFFFIDDSTLLFAVGDVSGKGVPAALFMAVAMQVLKRAASERTGAAAIVKYLNDKLSDGNDAFMFVTFFLAILDIETGRLEYCNGGHNPPYIMRVDGTLIDLKERHGMALGIAGDMPYGSAETVMNPGDYIYIYTDGVTEAMDVDEHLFTEERLEAALRSVPPGTSPNEVISAVNESVRLFALGAPQADDITSVSLRYLKK